MISITVGKSRVVSYICYDKDNNPNPVDDAGNLLDVTDHVWSLGEPATKTTPSSFSLAVLEGGKTARLTAMTAPATVAVYCDALNSEGVKVHGGALVDSVEAGVVVPPTTVAHLGLQFGPEE